MLKEKVNSISKFFPAEVEKISFSTSIKLHALENCSYLETTFHKRQFTHLYFMILAVLFHAYNDGNVSYRDNLSLELS